MGKKLYISKLGSRAKNNDSASFVIILSEFQVVICLNCGHQSWPKSLAKNMYEIQLSFLPEQNFENRATFPLFQAWHSSVGLACELQRRCGSCYDWLREIYKYIGKLYRTWFISQKGLKICMSRKKSLDGNHIVKERVQTTTKTYGGSLPKVHVDEKMKGKKHEYFCSIFMHQTVEMHQSTANSRSC